jgi:hypothetical protein
MNAEYCSNCEWTIKRFNLDPQASIYVLVNTLADAVRKSDESQNKKGEEQCQTGKKKGLSSKKLKQATI